MAAGSKHYLPNGKEHKGPVHKMDGKIHTVVAQILPLPTFGEK